ncbi:uncharacterized protein LOC134218554 [Armigeres subalbatus]|uniref:uncharacterized protein LOC134218554 n=1 Tax=Armigeres subalbatus TaxID=124917 RepID=UPI002ED0778F
MTLKWLILFLCLFVKFSSGEPKELRCKLERSKICLLENLSWTGPLGPKLPNLSSKHTLIVNSGSVSNFSEVLVNQLGNIIKLQLGQLDIRTIYISPKWVSLKAESNQIFELMIEDLPRPVDGDDYSKSFENISSSEPEQEEFRINTEVSVADEPVSRPINNLRLLNLKNNKLKSINKLKFLYQLEELILDGNQIEYFEMDTFGNMQMLKKVSLKKNKINQITTEKQIYLPALEHLSLAYNELKKLDVEKWTMLQLANLDLSHNHLNQMDVKTLDQFVSLEKLAMDKNSWHCTWLDSAVKNIERNNVQLEYYNEPCPDKQSKLKGLCCSYAQPVEDESLSALDRIKRIEDAHSNLKTDLNEKVNTFQNTWTENWKALHQQAEEKLKPYKELESRMQKDDNNKAKQAGENLERLINDCKRLIDELQTINQKNKEYSQRFTNLFYTTLAEKNKLIQEMSTAAKLQEEMKKYEVSFNANN